MYSTYVCISFCIKGWVCYYRTFKIIPMPLPVLNFNYVYDVLHFLSTGSVLFINLILKDAQITQFRVFVTGHHLLTRSCRASESRSLPPSPAKSKRPAFTIIVHDNDSQAQIQIKLQNLDDRLAELWISQSDRFGIVI